MPKAVNRTVPAKLSALIGAVMAVAMGATAPVMAQNYEGVEDLPDIRLTVTDYNTPGTPAGDAVQAYADYVAEQSNGKIQMEIYWSSALMGPAEHAEGIASGLADFGLVSPIYTPADFPIANWLTTLGSQAYGGIPYGIMVLNAAFWDFAMSNEQLKQEFNDRGLEIMGASGALAFDMMCRQPIESLADARGKRARTAGQVFAWEVEALGMVPVPLVPTEMYEAFSRGILDCVVLHPSGYQDFGLVDVTGDKYFINSAFSGFMSSYYAINKDRWDALPPLAQQIIKDGFAEQIRTSMQGLVARHVSFGEILDSGSVIAVDPAEDFHAALRAHQADQIAGMAATAPASVEDPQAMIDEYFGYIEKWSAIVTGELGIQEQPYDVEARRASWDQPIDWEPYFDRALEEITGR